MRSIVELIVNNQKNSLKEFNMSSTQGTLVNSLIEKFPYNLNNDNEMPVRVKSKPSWDIIENESHMYLNKTYYFESNKHMLYFINEALNESKNKNHFPELIVKKNSIEISLFTEDILEVTETDVELSKTFDEIYEEIKIVYRS